jgi:predicted DNA-binding transcriptional regulator AlpA
VLPRLEEQVVPTPKKPGVRELLDYPVAGRNIRKDELALRIGVSVSTIDNLITSGHFPTPKRLGKIPMWSGEQLIEAGILK